jgi:hypothetical protein
VTGRLEPAFADIRDRSRLSDARLGTVDDEERPQGIWAVPLPPGTPWPPPSRQPEWDGPSPIMLEALKLLQRDLDETGLSRLQMMLAANRWAYGDDEKPYLDGVVVVRADHRGGDDISDGINLDAATVNELAPSVARSVGYCLVQGSEPIYWPMCPRHDRRMTASEDDQPPAWRCTPSDGASHLVIPIGQLSTILSEYTEAHPIWTGMRRG